MDGTPTSDHGGAPGEESLLHAARAGDAAAVERLYADHVDSARRLATILAGSSDAEELVAESFSRVLAQLRSGGGPTSSFRAYLNTTIRNLHRDQFRRHREEPVSDRPWLLDEGESPVDDFVESLDANGATDALASLPGAWQRVLWHLEVEGRKPAEVADLMATSAASVSSLAYRAREGLRRAYLDQYAGPTPIEAGCRWTRARLSQYVRDDLSARAAGKVATHLETCSTCSAAHAGMAELNTKLAALLFPVVLVGAMKALDATAGGAATSSPLIAELTARAAGTPVKEAASAAGSGSGGLGRPSTRVSVMVAAAVVALVAIAATTFALARDETAPRTAPQEPSTTGATVDTTPSATPTPTTAPTTPATPTQPPTPTPSAPTAAPTTAPTAPVPTTPSAPSPSVPVVPVPTTPVPSPPTTQPTSPPPTATEPQPTVVRPMAPAAAPITRCDSYGSLRIPRTVGVRYTLAAGDGRQGNWTVTATAEPGYALAKGAPRRFTGDLGRYHACPPPLAIREVTTTHSGTHADDPWQVTVTPTAPDQERRALTVSYWFDTQIVVLRRLGDGWTCRGPGGADITDGPFAARSRLTCAYGERGQHPPPLSLIVRARNGSRTVVPPSGTVALAADGDVIDVEDFDSLDR